MPKHTLFFASIITTLLLAGYLGLSLWEKSSELAGWRASAEQASELLQKYTNELLQTKQQVGTLLQEKESFLRAQKNLEKEMRNALESKDITISQLQGKLTVSILDRILYDSGQAVLKPEGEQVLAKIAQILQQHPTRQIHVIGHTDNVPIGPAARNRFPSNWELSTARATAAVRYLSEKGGVDAHRLGAVGYGEFRPIASNANEEGRSRNRRIAIVVLSEELAGSDAVNPPAPQTLTNALPGTVVTSTNKDTNQVVVSSASTNLSATNPPAVTNNSIPATNFPSSTPANTVTNRDTSNPDTNQ